MTLRFVRSPKTPHSIPGSFVAEATRSILGNYSRGPPHVPWSGTEGSHDTIVSLKVDYCVGDVNAQHQVTGLKKDKPTFYQSQPGTDAALRSFRSRISFLRRPKITSKRQRSLGD